MTESNIGSDRHRNPSSAEIDIVKLRERHIALKEDVGGLKEVLADVKELLIGHINNSDNRHAQLLATFNQHNLEDSTVHTKVLQIDEHLKNTDARLENMNKRDPVTFWTSMGAAATTIGTILYVIFNGKPPSTP